MQAVEFYSGGVVRPHPPPDSAYKSLGSVFAPKDSPPGRETKKKQACSVQVNPIQPTPGFQAVKSSRSVQNMAERSMSVSESERTRGLSSRTPHRTAGYGGAGQPSRAPHRFGLGEMRASYSERISSRQKTGNRVLHSDVYKSNSSLDLDHEIDMMETAVHGKREFGSHGSLEVAGRGLPSSFHPPTGLPSSFHPPPVLPGPGEGPAAVSTLTRPTHFNGQLNRSEESTGSVVSTGSLDQGDQVDGGQSPKQKKKGSGGFWNKDKSSRKSQKSIFKKKKENELIKSDLSSEDNKLEDKHRRRFFSHHDIGSVCATLSAGARLKTLQRRNTTTGASAASNALRNSGGSGDSPDSEEMDPGDGVSNQLVLSCPYFRNEIGGEQERQIALTRETGRNWGEEGAELRVPCHTPRMARGFCLLEQPNTHWKNGICPYATGPAVPTLERTDAGSAYYKNYFYAKEHQNWFGGDENLGPIAISIRRERVPLEEGRIMSQNLEQFMYRLIVRTSELLPLRGTVLEDSIPALKSEKVKTIPTREVLEFSFPELQLSSLHLGVQSGPCEEQLVKLDQLYNDKSYKVGVMYCRASQQTEEEMYNNEEGGPAFNEFLDLIGQRIRLKGFNKYKAGLCNKNDSTGEYSVYTEHEEREIMFHVSTLLPYTHNNRQQLPRKRHIGNDIVTVVFQEPGALPFIPNIRSQFQHVFIIVRAHNPCTDNTQYSVAVTRSANVPMFGPPLPPGALFSKNSSFTKFLLSKVINAENAVHRSDKFVSMATRTRQEYLKDLSTNFVTPTTIDSGNKFALFAPKKKMSARPRFSPDASLRGALSWAVVVEDCSTNQQLEAFVAISSDTLVIIQDNSHRDLLFITACKSILGWSATHNSIRIFYHQGECVIIHSKDWEADDMAEISARLKSVSPGAASQEFSLRRNQLGQLGFHVQHDGLITEVENFGYAWQTGLRQGSRLVEICKHPVTTLTHEQMVDLLKTSMMVTVTVIPPHPDGSPRQGCNLTNCSYAFGGFEGDYENVNGEGEKTSLKPGSMQAPSNGKMRYERSLSPPRSSSSSGYGTGSSSKSFTDPPDPRYTGVPGAVPEGTLTSSSSGLSSDERWYDFMDVPLSSENSPPPLPTRIGSKTSAFQTVSKGRKEDEYPGFTGYTPPVRGYNGYESASSSDTVKSSSTVHRGESTVQEETRSVDARSTYLTDFELTVPAPDERENLSVEKEVDYLRHERLAALKPSIDPQDSLINERLLAGRSEDELSSSSHSPNRPRQGRRNTTGATTPSSTASNSSRGHSPRTTSGLPEAAKKKVARSARNSANLASSTLQEDLMKLISPEYTEEGSVQDSPLSKLPKKTLTELTLMKSRSRENIARLEDNVSNEVSFHMARPATVISNSSHTSSPGDRNLNISNLSKDDPTSPDNSSRSKVSPVGIKVGKHNGINPSVPPGTVVVSGAAGGGSKPEDMDWNSLVDTATKAMFSSEEEEPSPGVTRANPSPGVPEDKVRRLLERVTLLEKELEGEKKSKEHLSSQVDQLKEENVRLQEESQTAAQQLRRFTEWFFQTIDKS